VILDYLGGTPSERIFFTLGDRRGPAVEVAPGFEVPKDVRGGIAE